MAGWLNRTGLSSQLCTDSSARTSPKAVRQAWEAGSRLCRSTTYQIGQDDFEWQVVARRVQQNSSVVEAGEVGDDRLVDISL